MTAAASVGTPGYFGAGGELFGFYYPPAARARRAALLCPPLGQDMIRTFRVYRLLAQTLAARGYAVMRFDYFGTGDSSGESMMVDWNRCIADASEAASTLRTNAGCDSIVAFGARLGANIALSASKAARFDEVIVWDPALSGRQHIERMDALQAALLSDATRFLKPRADADVSTQWVGFDVSSKLRMSLSDVQLDALPSLKMLVDSQPSADYRAWRESTGATTAIVRLANRTSWDELDTQEDTIIAHDMIETVARHLDLGGARE